METPNGDLRRNLEMITEVGPGAVGINGSWEPWGWMRSPRELGEKDDKQAGDQVPASHVFEG